MSATTATATAPREGALQRILKKPITATFIAIALGFVVAAVLLTAAGYDAGASFSALFEGVLSKPKYISNTIIKAAPIILTGISVAFAFKTGMFNIGAEGQYVAGTICAVLVGSTLDLPMVLQIPVVVLAGVLGGAIIGSITGFLKARFGIHEVITAIMLNWTMLYLNNFVVNSAMFHRPSSTSSIPVNPSSYTMIPPEWKLSDVGLDQLRQVPWLFDFLVKSDVNIAFVVAILVAVAIWFVLYRSKLGFELPAVDFARQVMASTSSFWPLPSMPARPTISPACTVRLSPLTVSMPRSSATCRSRISNMASPGWAGCFSTVRFTWWPTIMSASCSSVTLATSTSPT